MGTLKKLIGVGVITGVVLYAYMRSFSAKLDNRRIERKKAEPLLV